MPNQPNTRLGIERFLQTEVTKLPSWLKTACRPVARFFDRFLTWSSYNRFVSRLDLEMDFKGFIQECVIEYDLDIDDVNALAKRIPKEGPVIMVSNHPTGFLETVILPHLIMQSRPDLCILANEMLAQVHWIAPQIIPLNVFKTSGVREVMQQGVRWLEQGGVLLIYPSGEVADYKKVHKRIVDGDWSRLPLMLAEKTNAKLMHLNLDAKTSRWFRAVSRVCRPARVMWLMKELYRQGGKQVSCYSSSVSSVSTLPALPKAKLIKFLHALNECLPVAELYQGAIDIKTNGQNEVEPLQETVALSLVQQELQALPETAVIYSHNATTVYVIPGRQIPTTLKYIQVERERTFREVNMGTGESLDGDRHDEKCLQVVVWDKKADALIASTRCEIYCADQQDTYLSDLYNIDATKLLKLGDMMEISRTFIMPSYQKSFSSLLSLWRGVTRIVLRHPRVRFVSGVVSIAGDRMKSSLFDCLATYVKLVADRNKLLSQCFSPKVPYKMQGDVPSQVKYCLSLVSSVDELEHVFKELADGGCQFPVLFRQYESLGTVPLGISVDEDFASCIDVLQVWDTYDLRSEKLRLFFGDEGMEQLRERAKQSNRVYA